MTAFTVVPAARPGRAGSTPSATTARAPRPRPPTAPPPPKRDDNWEEHYDLPQDSHYTLKFWQDIEESIIQGEVVKLWVFQPTGLCQPVKLHLERPSAVFDVEFGALTADITREVVDLR